jgi:hypothetical protein
MELQCIGKGTAELTSRIRENQAFVSLLHGIRPDYHIVFYAEHARLELSPSGGRLAAVGERCDEDRVSEELRQDRWSKIRFKYGHLHDDLGGDRIREYIMIEEEQDYRRSCYKLLMISWHNGIAHRETTAQNPPGNGTQPNRRKRLIVMS